MYRGNKMQTIDEIFELAKALYEKAFNIPMLSGRDKEEDAFCEKAISALKTISEKDRTNEVWRLLAKCQAHIARPDNHLLLVEANESLSKIAIKDRIPFDWYYMVFNSRDIGNQYHAMNDWKKAQLYYSI